MKAKENKAVDQMAAVKDIPCLWKNFVCLFVICSSVHLSSTQAPNYQRPVNLTISGHLMIRQCLSSLPWMISLLLLSR